MLAASPLVPVSFEDEPLICVDEADVVVGYRDKAACHRGTGILHRAFSLFIFTPAGELIVQQRSARKRLWPGFWATSCCSHPRRGETIAAAAERRLGEELGLTCVLTPLYTFTYQAQYDADGAEHELCTVLVGCTSAVPQPHPHEVLALKTVAPRALDAALRDAPHAYAPWLHLEWPTLRRAHWSAVDRVVAAGA